MLARTLGRTQRLMMLLLLPYSVGGMEVKGVETDDEEGACSNHDLRVR